MNTIDIAIRGVSLKAAAEIEELLPEGVELEITTARKPSSAKTKKARKSLSAAEKWAVHGKRDTHTHAELSKQYGVSATSIGRAIAEIDRDIADSRTGTELSPEAQAEAEVGVMADEAAE